MHHVSKELKRLAREVLPGGSNVIIAAALLERNVSCGSSNGQAPYSSNENPLVVSFRSVLFQSFFLWRKQNTSGALPSGICKGFLDFPQEALNGALADQKVFYRTR